MWGANPFEVEPDAAVLHQAVESELRVDPDELDDESLGARCLRLRAERDRLEVAIARADAAFEASRAYARLGPGYAKAAQWLTAQARIPVREARAAFRFARRLRLLPQVAAAVVAGTITAWHARKLAGACSNPGRARRMQADQAELVAAGEARDAREFAARVRHWTEVHFGDEIDARAAAVDARRAVHLSRGWEQTLVLDGTLHPVWGTIVETELARTEAELFARDWARAKEVHGASTRTEHLWRSRAQRRHDALVVMALRAAMVGPGARLRRPLLTVLVDWPTLHGRVCELENGVPITVGQALEVLRVADVERAVWGPDDRIAISEKARVFRGAERRAVELRDRFCTAPGCDEPPDRSDVDHVVPYEQGGPTRQDNGQLLCPANHPGRRARPEDRPLPWELVEEEWERWHDPDDPDHAGEGDLAAEFAYWHERVTHDAGRSGGRLGAGRDGLHDDTSGTGSEPDGDGRPTAPDTG